MQRCGDWAIERVTKRLPIHTIGHSTLSIDAFVERLRAGQVPKGQQERVAIMCAEALWWRCHRRIVADWLIAADETVRHIMSTSIDDARLNAGVLLGPDGTVTYPAEADAQ